MASSVAIPVIVLVVVLTLSACSCERVYYVKPSQFTTCPADPCFTLEDYISGSEVFISDTVFCFLPGFHYIYKSEKSSISLVYNNKECC